MESLSISLIFFSGALTFLVNWYLFKKKSRPDGKDFLINLLISIIGAITTGIIFVSALHLAHG